MEVTGRPCPVCGGSVARKVESVPGPQPRYCGRRCQTVAAHRRRRSRIAVALSDQDRIVELEAELAELRSLVDRIDWARVPPGAVREPGPTERDQR